MSKTAKLGTRSISVRVPMETYVRLLEDCHECKMSVTEFLTLKLLGKSTPSVKSKANEDSKNAVKKILENERIKEMENDIRLLRDENKKHKVTIGSLKSAHKSELLKSGQTADKAKKSLEKRLNDANSYIKSLHSKCTSNKWSQVSIKSLKQF